MTKRVPWQFGRNQKAWLRALRSGNFEQTEGKLFDGEGYCCLGVACVVAGRTFRKDKLTGDYGIRKNENVYSDDLEEVLLPEDIRRKLKMRTSEGEPNKTYLENDVELYSAVEMNDNEGYDFDQIADAMAKNRQHYFTGPA